MPASSIRASTPKGCFATTPCVTACWSPLPQQSNQLDVVRRRLTIAVENVGSEYSGAALLFVQYSL